MATTKAAPKNKGRAKASDVERDALGDAIGELITTRLPKTISETGLTLAQARGAGVAVGDDGTLTDPSAQHRAMMLGLAMAGTIGVPGLHMLATISLRFGQDHAGVAVNMRKTDRTRGLEELAATIVSDGILQPLLVWRDTAGDGFDYVIDGSRRLSAVHEIRKMLPESFDTLPALLIVGGTAEDAVGKSLAANVTQVPPHQVDQFEAFSDLVATLPAGADPIQAVVGRFGVSPIVAERRLALGGSAPELRNAWRAGDIEFEEMKVYMLLRDAGAQAALFKKLGKNSPAWKIRQAILGDDDYRLVKLLAFVGAAEYEAGGGTVIRDLFNTNGDGGGGGVSDIPLLRQLAVAKIDAKIAELTAEGWSWALRSSELPPSWSHVWRKLPSGKKATEAERSKSGVAVDMAGDGKGFQLTYGVVMPAVGKDKATKSTKEKKKGTASAPAERGLSQNMMHQLRIRATVGTAKALELQPDLALAAIVAAFVSNAGPLQVHSKGLGAVDRRIGNFSYELKSLIKAGKPAMMKVLGSIAANALDFTADIGTDRPLDDEDTAALIAQLNPKAHDKAMHDIFAEFAQEYFEGIPLPHMRAAIGESGIVGKVTYETDVQKWGRDQCVGYSMADNGDGPQILATGWLPPELRGPGYDGPKVKAPAKGKGKTPAKKKGR